MEVSGFKITICDLEASLRSKHQFLPHTFIVHGATMVVATRQASMPEPADFTFQLTAEEISSLRSQFATSKLGHASRSAWIRPVVRCYISVHSRHGNLGGL